MEIPIEPLECALCLFLPHVAIVRTATTIVAGTAVCTDHKREYWDELEKQLAPILNGS